MKKILSLFLCLAMLFNAMSLVAFAEETDNGIVDISPTDGSLNIDDFSLQERAGLGGKKADDISMAFVLDESGTTSEIKWNYTLSGIESSKVGTSGGAKGVYFAFNLYASGEATAIFQYGDGYPILTWKPDGTAAVNGVSDPITMVRNRWHKVVVSMNDYSGGRLDLFVDGVRIKKEVDSSWGKISTKSPLSIGVSKGSKNGIVAFDDGYYSYWTSPTNYNKIKNQELPIFTETADISCNSAGDSLEYAEDTYADVNELIAGLRAAFSNAAQIRVYNNDLSAPASGLDDVKIVVIKLQSGAYCYFNIKMREFLPDSVNFIASDGDIGVTATFSNPTTRNKSVVAVMVLKDANGIIQKIAASPQTTVYSMDNDVAVSIEPIESENLIAEVFFIENWSARQRLFDNIYKNE